MWGLAPVETSLCLKPRFRAMFQARSADRARTCRSRDRWHWQSPALPRLLSARQGPSRRGFCGLCGPRRRRWPSDDTAAAFRRGAAWPAPRAKHADRTCRIRGEFATPGVTKSQQPIMWFGLSTMSVVWRAPPRSRTKIAMRLEDRGCVLRSTAAILRPCTTG